MLELIYIVVFHFVVHSVEEKSIPPIYDSLLHFKKTKTNKDQEMWPRWERLSTRNTQSPDFLSVDAWRIILP